MKKGVSFDTILKRQLDLKEIHLPYDHRRFYLQIAHLIADLRAQRGMSQAEVANAAGVSQPMIARLEAGDATRIPTVDTIYKVLKALGRRMEIKISSDEIAA